MPLHSSEPSQPKGSSLPATVFREEDVERITGLQLSQLKSSLMSFLNQKKGGAGFPETDSLTGVWIFGLSDRYESEKAAYVSTSELAKTLRERESSPSEKYFYRDVQFVWNLQKLHLGRWTFHLTKNDEIRAVASSFVEKSDKQSKPVNLWVTLDREDGYKVRDWTIEDNPLH